MRRPPPLPEPSGDAPGPRRALEPVGHIDRSRLVVDTYPSPPRRPLWRGRVKVRSLRPSSGANRRAAGSIHIYM
eukprot:scaffold5232_cov408-Prasinococcus_capsulatus_cf.AAC.1